MEWIYFAMAFVWCAVWNTLSAAEPVEEPDDLWWWWDDYGGEG